MDTLKMPMRKLRQTYTKSELIIMAWDSKHKHWVMSQKYNKNKVRHPDQVDTHTRRGSNGVVDLGDRYQLPDGVNEGVAIPKKFFNNDGDIDLRQATGPQALGYLRALGINVMPAIKFA